MNQQNQYYIIEELDYFSNHSILFANKIKKNIPFKFKQ